MLDYHYSSNLARRTKRWWLFTILSVITLSCVSCSSSNHQTASSRKGMLQSPHITEGGRMPLTDLVPPQGNIIPTASAPTPQSVQLTTTPIAQPPSPTPIIPRSYEAESPQNTLAGGAKVYSCSGCSGGKRVGNIGNSGTLQFNNVWEPSTGNYTFMVYYVNGDTNDRGMNVNINGKDSWGVTLGTTHNWDTPAAFTITMGLNAGYNTIMFYHSSGYGVDIDRIVV